MLISVTDSLMDWVETAEIYNELIAPLENSDFPSVLKANPFFDASNNKVIGKFKDEANRKPITEFGRLRPNMYSFLRDDKSHTLEMPRTKGIKRGVSREIRHDYYIDKMQRAAETYLPKDRNCNPLRQLYPGEVPNFFPVPLKRRAVIVFIISLGFCSLSSFYLGGDGWLCRFEE